MTDTRIVPVLMPKWGLSMREGKLASWLVEDGATINPGTALLEVETDKIAGSLEATESGVLRRRVGSPDTIYPVKALLGVIADTSVPDAEIDKYVADFVAPATDADEDEQGPKYETAETTAGRLRYAKRGSGGENVILIHGFGGDLDNWLFNIDALAEAATVYALDLPGHGQSVKSVANPGLQSMTAALAGFMDKVGIASAHLVGHSMGGGIAMQMALNHPGKVKSLTLIAPIGLGPEIGDYVGRFTEAQGRKDLKPVLETLFADKSLVSRQLVDDVMKYKRLDGVDALLKNLRNGLFDGQRQRDAPGEALAGKAPPTLVIWGKEDRVVSSTHSQSLPGASVHVLDNSGHMVFMEKASEVNALIKKHIAN